MRLFRSLAAATAAFALLAGCNSDSETSPSDTSARATATTKAQSEPSPDPSKPPAGVRFLVIEGVDGDSVFAFFSVSENDVAKGTARSAAQKETVTILKYARAAYPDASKVFVVGSLPPVEGSDEDRGALDAEYQRATIEKMDFDQIDPAQIWDMSDDATVHPELQ